MIFGLDDYLLQNGKSSITTHIILFDTVYNIYTLYTNWCKILCPPINLETLTMVTILYTHVKPNKYHANKNNGHLL